MTSIDIEYCNDVKKLKAMCLEYHSQMFRIRDILGEESMWRISPKEAVNRIRDHLKEQNKNLDRILMEESDGRK